MTVPLLIGAALVVALSAASGATIARQDAAPARPTARESGAAERIAPYVRRFGRARPIVAVIGENGGTELTDFVIPYGILKQSGVAEVMTLGIRSGALTMRPALHVQPEATAARFDAMYPQGADYVIVPAMVKRDDPAMRAWLVRQSAKGATIVSICDGALVVANAGLLKGHRATAHWATLDYRRKTYADVRWVENARYVADGRLVSSAGISAAIPTALALVEAIGGHARAAEVARRVGTADWSPAHDSRAFAPKLGRNLTAFATTNYLNGWFHHQESVGVSVAPGVDEIGLALVADAYSRSGRGKAYAMSSTLNPVATAHGLTIVPDRTYARSGPDRTVLVPAAGERPMLDKVLKSIARDYGRATARGHRARFRISRLPWLSAGRKRWRGQPRFASFSSPMTT
jgi:putative intracellular protease/amidase